MATPVQPPQQYSKEDIVKMVKAGMSPHGGWQNAGQPLDLSGADLTGSTLGSADLSGANLRNADLRKSALSGLTLTNADLRQADLRGLNFKGVELSATDLRNSNLQGANLNEVNAGLLPWQLAGTDLTGATLPKPLETLYEKLGMVSEISDSAKKLFLALLGGCLYSWLTIATTKDVDLITNRASSPLPIIQTAIPIIGFYVVAPIILLCIYFYFHFYLQKLWEELAQLPAIFPDGKPLHQRADPWLFNDLVRAHLSKLRPGRPFLSKFQHKVSIMLAWWLVPITLLLFWGRYLPRHDLFWSLVLAVLLSISITSALQLYRLCRETLGGQARIPFDWKPILKQGRTHALNPLLKRRRTYIDILRIGIVVTAVIVTTSASISGVPTGSEPAISKTLGLVISVPRSATWAPTIMNWIGYSPFADLSNTEISIKPTNWSKQSDRDLDLVKGADLSGQDLRYADAHGAFLAKSSLWDSNLENIDLSSADLRKANLSLARLDSAKLMFADLREAILDGARLGGADLAGVDLTGASLRRADLTGTQLTQITGQLVSNVGVPDQVLTVTAPVQISYADLTQAHGLSVDALKNCDGWEMAYFSPDILKQLGLPPDHNEALKAYRDSKSQEPFDDAWIKKWRASKPKTESKPK